MARTKSRHFFSGISLTLTLVLASCLNVTAQRPAPGDRTHSDARRTGASAPGYKGVFEPVNYGQDINLTDVFFVSPEVGWVSGEHATLLKTTDAGATWTAQIGGDPNGNEKTIGQLRFLDARHGWAVTGDDPARLLRTLDGENWEQIGEAPVGAHSFVDYAFTSVRHGVMLGGNNGGFFVTNDGGRHWQNVGPCQITVRLQGLAQRQDCYPLKLQMFSSNSGLAITSWRSPEAPNATTFAIFRTGNGGQSWDYVVPAFHNGGNLDIFFTDLNHGVAVFDDRTYVTADGGRNWHALLSGSPETGQSRLRFADPQIGWSLGDKYPSLALSYTTDGGQHWKTFAPLGLPGSPNAKQLSLSLPRRDRAYIAGPHGMIYRYRVVAADYRAANAFDAPLMPGFGGAELSAKANAIHRDIDLLRGKLASLTGVAATVNSNSGIASSTTSGATTPAAGDQSVSAAAVNADQTAASGGTGQSATAAPPAPDQAAAASIDQTVAAIADGGAGPGSPAATSPDAAGASAGSFVQDTSPPSAPLADCCAAAMQQLQTDTAGFVAQVPQVTSQTRPLNLIIAGLQLAATLINQGQSLWSQFKVLKHAPSPQAAMQALQQLSTTLSTVQQASSNGLQNPGGWFAANAPASFTQDVGSTTTGAVVGNPVPGTLPAQTAAQQSGAQPQSSGTNPQQNPTQNTVDQTLDNAKQKLKNKLKWPK